MKKFVIVLIMILFVGTGRDLSLHAQSSAVINVGLILDAQKAGFRSDAAFKIFDSDTGELVFHDNYAKILVEKGKFTINNQVCSSARIKLAPGGKPIFVYSGNYLPYRGNLVLHIKSRNSFLVVNEINIDEYLMSVLGGEVSYLWPLEALKAQAVAARTYALYKKERNAAGEQRPFDVVATIKDQLYRGIISEKPSCAKAVFLTKGLIIKYDGKIIKAYYHASCGGATQDGNTVFEEGGDYLVSVPCEFCRNETPVKWKKIINSNDIKRTSESLGERVGKIYILMPDYFPVSGRLDDFVVFHTLGANLLSGVDFRGAIGPYNLKSTNFKIKPLKTISLSGMAAKKKFGVLYDRSGKKLFYDSAGFDEDELEEKAFICVYEYKKNRISVIGEDAVVVRKDALSVNVINAENSAAVKDGFYVLTVREDVLEEAPSSNEQFFGLFNEKDTLKIPVSFLLTGRGWGHGVGMCQWGSFGMAKKGYDFKEILGHYYTGVTIEEY